MRNALLMITLLALPASVQAQEDAGTRPVLLRLDDQ